MLIIDWRSQLYRGGCRTGLGGPLIYVGVGTVSEPPDLVEFMTVTFAARGPSVTFVSKGPSQTLET